MVINFEEDSCPLCDGATPWSGLGVTSGSFQCSHCKSAFVLVDKRISNSNTSPFPRLLFVVRKVPLSQVKVYAY